MIRQSFSCPFLPQLNTIGDSLYCHEVHTHITCDDQLSANVKPNPYFNFIPACSGVACLRVGNHHPGLVKATNVLTIHMGALTSGL